MLVNLPRVVAVLLHFLRRPPSAAPISISTETPGSLPLHPRHPLSLPIPQSLLLQETFTVNKKEKHYSLETRLVIDEREDSILTLTLGYPTKNPHVSGQHGQREWGRVILSILKSYGIIFLPSLDMCKIDSSV